MSLQSEIKYLNGVGPKRAELLEKELGIRTVWDLVQHFPYKYIDRSRFYMINEIDSASTYIQIKGQIKSYSIVGEGKAKRLIAIFYDGQNAIELIFFKSHSYFTNTYKLNTTYIIFGKPNVFNGKYSFVHPEIELPTNERITGFMPLYHTTEKMKKQFLHSKAMQKLIYSALFVVDKNIAETLPDYILKKYKLMGLYEAYNQVHFPTNMQSLEHAQARLKYEELFYVQLSILRQAGVQKARTNGHVFETIGHYFNKFFYENLPFELTNAQKRVIKEIRADLRGAHQMNRLLQGDVGSGKTMVALMCMLIAIDNKFQACIVAPTEILATQHYHSFVELLKGLDLNVKLLIGSTKKKEREILHQQLQDGSLDILVGTHAIMEDTVKFHNLGLVIIDEQHRFGVAQRAKLWRKNAQPPHVLVMTATPIPRTLAMTVYGDLEVSVIDELPPNRKPIETYHVFENKRGKLNNLIRKQLSEGRQIYIVYPLISESEKSDLKDLEAGYEQTKQLFPEIGISMAHGKMKPKEKDEAMQEFISGKSRILVATTVIEVGVNVPNASVMIIENAERFGLSQLHQLRGRVGRGADQSFCILMTKYEISADTRKRLSIMTETNDGFKVAEADLQLRGPGDLDGTMQSGLPFTLHIANIVRDSNILQIARNDVKQLLSQDKTLHLPEHSMLLTQLQLRANDSVSWSAIS